MVHRIQKDACRIFEMSDRHEAVERLGIQKK